MERTIIIGSGNAKKIAEIRDILGANHRRFVPIGEIPRLADMPEPDETGATFEDNAAIKASAYARAAGTWCLADDSGLEVDALNGAPGVYSARYAAPETGWSDGLARAQRDEMNNQRLLRELDGKGDRTGRFVCVIALANPEGRVVSTTRGTFEGAIGEPPRVPSGEQGFGYDPLFLVGPHFERTSAELSPDEKHAMSHRGEALRLMLEDFGRIGI